MDAHTLYKKVFLVLPRLHDIKDVSQNSIAIGILPGGGNHEASNPRLSEVPWKTLTQKVLVAGTRNDPYYEFDEICSLLGGVPKHILVQGCTEILNTLDQMLWLIACILKDPEITTLILSTSCYHLPRCVLTFIKQWLERSDGRRLQLVLLPTSDPLPTGTTTTNQTVAGELTRIAFYQQKGDVATADEFLAFIRSTQQ